MTTYTKIRVERDMSLAITPLLEMVEQVLLDPLCVHINDTADILVSFEQHPVTSGAYADLVRRSLNRQLAEFHGVQ